MEGRDDECAIIEGLLARARQGRAGVLAICGDPGIGKTTLCEYAVTQASDMTVLRVLGVEWETDLPLAGMFELLRPLRDHVVYLPVEQRKVVSALFAGSGQAASDRFALGVATLSLLAHAAEQRAVLVVVDDSQWLDELSGGALAFAFRRLAADAVAVLLCHRSNERDPVAGPWQHLKVDGLSPAAVRSLLSSRPITSVNHAVADALGAATRGNPLALIEVSESLTPRQRAGVDPLPDPLPLGERGLAAFSRPFVGFSARTLQALAVIAAAGPGGASLVPSALASLNLSGPDLDPAERSGVLVVVDGDLQFPHPLVRAASLAAAGTVPTRLAHHALAQAARDNDPQRYAHHLAYATVIASEEVAVALDQAAEFAESRGGPAAGAAARIRAAAASPDGPARDVRRVRAADACFLAGRRGDASRLVNEVLSAGSIGPQRYQALALQASLALWGGSLHDATPILFAALDELAMSAPDLAALVGMPLSTALSSIGRLQDQLIVITRCRALPITDPAIRYLMENYHAATALLLGDPSVLSETERTYPPDGLSEEVVRRFPMQAQCLTQMWVWAERYPAAWQEVNRQIDAARKIAALTLLPVPLMVRVELHWTAGNLARARVDADEALDLGIQVGFEGLIGYGHALRALIAATEGDEPTAHLHAAQARAISHRVGEQPILVYLNHGLGLLALGLGLPATAAEHLALNVDLRAITGVVNPVAVPWQGDYVEALINTARPDEARRALDELKAVADRTGSRWAHSVIYRCRALLGEPGWPDLFEHAATEQTELPFERARTLLYWGEALRRARQIRSARTPLSTAVELFRQQGAHCWTRRAEAELRAAGVPISSAEGHLHTPLTDQELQVCLAVADGATNKEAAAALFLSPKTIEYHLHRAFIKLGISNRAQLARGAADGLLHGGRPASSPLAPTPPAPSRSRY